MKPFFVRFRFCSFSGVSSAVLVIAVILAFWGCSKQADYDSLIAQGRAILDQEDPQTAKKAQDLFGQAIRQEPQKAAGYYWHGMAAGRLFQWADAVEDFSSAIERDPALADAYFRRALCLTVLNHADKAPILRDLAKTLELDPDHTLARRQLALMQRAR
jgi:tetratricopeptide (TPR) repeat protein